MLVDVHAHLDHHEETLDEALRQIDENAIFTISNSMDITSYRRNVEIAARSAFVLPIFGVHPWNATGFAERLHELEGSIRESPMLGEIGLDHRFVTDASQYPAQRRVFEFFLGAARDQGKAVNLHTSGAETEVLRLLDSYRTSRVIVHWYAGPLDVLEELLAMGAYFTVGVELSCSAHIADIARAIPLDRLLTETDNPGGPEWLSGVPGMPLLIRDVLRDLAKVRGMSIEDMTETIERNLERFVRGDPHLSAACAPILG